MYAALSPLQTRPLSEEKFRSLSRMSCASTRCLCRPAWAYFFFFCCLSLVFLTDSSSRGDETGFLSSGFAASLQFVYSRLSRLQRGGEPASLVSFSYLALKTAHRATHGLFCSVSLPTFPLRGKAGLFSNLGCPGFARLAHNCPTRLQQGG